MNDYELIREALCLMNSMILSGEDHSDLSVAKYKEALAAFDRLKLESMEERASYEAELSRLKGDSDG